MREILFRAFVPSEGDYYYIEKGNPCWLQFEGGKTTLWEEYESWCSGSGEWTSSESIREIKNFVLEQYTGLKDKNGVKAFEHDKIHIDGMYLGYILLTDGAFNLIEENNKSGSNIINQARMNRMEIIGNIHED